MPEGAPYYKSQRNAEGGVRHLVTFDKGATWSPADVPSDMLYRTQQNAAGELRQLVSADGEQWDEPGFPVPPAPAAAESPAAPAPEPWEGAAGDVPEGARTTRRGVDAPLGPTAGEAAATVATDPWKLGAEMFAVGASLAPEDGTGLPRTYPGQTEPGPAMRTHAGLPPPEALDGVYADLAQQRQAEIDEAEEHAPYAAPVARFATETLATAPAAGVAGRALTTPRQLAAASGAGGGAQGALTGVGASEATDPYELLLDAGKGALYAGIPATVLGGAAGAASAARTASRGRAGARASAQADEATGHADRARAEAIGAFDPGQRRAIERGHLRGEGVARQENLGREAERLFPANEGQTAAEYAARAGEAVEELGPQVGQAVTRASAEVPEGIRTADFVARLRGVQAEMAGRSGTANKALASRYEREIDDIVADFGDSEWLSPAQLERIKQNQLAPFEGKAYNTLPQQEGDALKVAQRIADEARGASRDAIMGRGEPPQTLPAKLGPGDFGASEGPVSVVLHHGGSADHPGPIWYTSSAESAKRYAKGGDVRSDRVVMQRPYVTSGVEIINATSGTVDRLRSEGYDGMIARFGDNMVPTRSNPNPKPQIYAVPFNKPRAAQLRGSELHAGGGATDATQEAIDQVMRDYASAKGIHEVASKRAGKEEGRLLHGADGESKVERAAEAVMHPIRTIGRAGLSTIGKRLTKTADEQANAFRSKSVRLHRRAEGFADPPPATTAGEAVHGGATVGRASEAYLAAQTGGGPGIEDDVREALDAGDPRLGQYAERLKEADAAGNLGAVLQSLHRDEQWRTQVAPALMGE